MRFFSFIFIVFALFFQGCSNTDQVLGDILPKIYEKIESSGFIDKLIEKIVQRVSTRAIQFREDFFFKIRKLGKTMEILIKSRPILVKSEQSKILPSFSKKRLSYLFQKKERNKRGYSPSYNPSQNRPLYEGEYTNTTRETKNRKLTVKNRKQIKKTSFSVLPERRVFADFRTTGIRGMT